MGNRIQRAFVGLPDPYEEFEFKSFDPQESIQAFHTMCDWETQTGVTTRDISRRCEILKAEIHKLSFEYGNWSMEQPMDKIKMLQFMIMCLYGHNMYRDYVQAPIEEHDSMSLKPLLGVKRTHREEEEKQEEEPEL